LCPTPGAADAAPERSGLGTGKKPCGDAAWNDDTRIEKMIYELNFGAFSKERLV